MLALERLHTFSYSQFNNRGNLNTCRKYFIFLCVVICCFKVTLTLLRVYSSSLHAMLCVFRVASAAVMPPTQNFKATDFISARSLTCSLEYCSNICIKCLFSISFEPERKLGNRSPFFSNAVIGSREGN